MKQTEFISNKKVTKNRETVRNKKIKKSKHQYTGDGVRVH